MDHKAKILQLLADGHQLAADAEVAEGIHEQERLMRRAIGYFDAAQTLLTAFAEFHNELVEHQQFVAARKYKRQHSF